MYACILLHINIRLNHVKLPSKSSNYILFNLIWDACDNFKILMNLLIISLNSKFFEDKNHLFFHSVIHFFVHLFVKHLLSTDNMRALCYALGIEQWQRGKDLVPRSDRFVSFYPILARICSQLNECSRFIFVSWWWKKSKIQIEVQNYLDAILVALLQIDIWGHMFLFVLFFFLLCLKDSLSNITEIFAHKEFTV